MILLMLSCKVNHLLSTENILNIEISNNLDFTDSNLVNNRTDINKISSILNTGKSKLVKFHPRYYIKITEYSGRKKVILINNKFYKTEGKTYTLSQNLEEYIYSLVNKK